MHLRVFRNRRTGWVAHGPGSEGDHGMPNQGLVRQEEVNQRLDPWRRLPVHLHVSLTHAAVLVHFAFSYGAHCRGHDGRRGSLFVHEVQLCCECGLAHCILCV